MKMPKQINYQKDKEVLDYLKEHTYKETAAYFQTSEKQISRMKARSQSVPSLIPEPETHVLEEKVGPADQGSRIIESQRPRIKAEKSTTSESETRHQKSMQTHSYKQNKNLFYQKKLAIKALIETLLAQGATKEEIQEVLNQY